MHISLFILLLVFISNLAHADPIVIAHRGASGYLPEHTLAAATLAHAQGADFIEQDLVLSKDLIPIVLHDIHIETTTNVAEIFPSRKRQDGRYYAIDFTLVELKTLKVHERTNASGEQVYPNRYQGSADFKIATFVEQIELIQQLNRQFGRKVGFYSEIKSPAWHKSQGADISKIVLDILRKYHLDDGDSATYIQCFDFAETKRLRNELGAKVKLVQLIGENSWQESETDYQYLKTKAGLQEISEVAQGIGPWIPQLFEGKSEKASAFAKAAKKSGLMIHPYTFRVDALPQHQTANQLLEILFNQVGVDGIFTDFPDQVIRFINKPAR